MVFAANAQFLAKPYLLVARHIGLGNYTLHILNSHNCMGLSCMIKWKAITDKVSAWIEEVNIKPYGEFKEQLIKSSKSGAFKEAVESIEDYIKNGDNPSKIVKRTLSDKSNGVSPAKMVRSNSVNNDEIQKTSGASTSFCTISPRKPTTSNLLDRPANIQRPKSASCELSVSTKEAMVLLYIPACVCLLIYLPHPKNFSTVTPHLDLKKVTETLKNKNICPSSMKFGFLGLGIMGSGIVKNLLHSGHTVIVWNRNPDKAVTIFEPNYVLLLQEELIEFQLK
uniref:6-phosphogluconate dehydrogenase NADP-binding domain-containing protein n=1 Tax=Timema cristinae TaxID=61476 RepID=A0A7R9CPU6_TIMCR|nr:unnamed protein product [Timema cristinae]